MTGMMLVLIVFVALWALQAVGTYWQMRHYRRVLGGLTREESAGFVGVGGAKARIGKGIVLILVADHSGKVRRALAMRGRTVLARFTPMPDLVGHSVDALRSGDDGVGDHTIAAAARSAAEQINIVRTEAVA